jgi:hypothetical protein
MATTKVVAAAAGLLVEATGLWAGGGSHDPCAGPLAEPSSPASRIRVTPTVLQATLSPAMPPSPGSLLSRTSDRVRARSCGAGEPAAVEVGELAAAGEQLVGWAGLDDPTVLDHGDLVGLDHGGEAVGDHDGGSSLA